MNVLWTGSVSDLSGYGVASREYIRALDSIGVEVAVDDRSFESWKNKDLVNQIVDKRMRFLMQQETKSNLHVIHLTPDNLNDYKKDGKVKISYFAWETSLVPKSWVEVLNEVPVEVWVPCNYLADVCVRSGINVPISVIPHAIPIPEEGKIPVKKIDLPKDRYKFYSIFQWSERKNPIGLIRAYYEEFRSNDKVCLVLKTYKNTAESDEKIAIRKEIMELKKKAGGTNAPPIVLIDDLVGVDGMLAIHNVCDCYITMTRSEGFCIPVCEAAAMGKPVIIPEYSAFLDHFDEENAYMIKVPEEVSVQNMDHISKMYTADMVWGNPSIESCREKMREAFEDQELAQKKGAIAREYISQVLNYEIIGNIIKDRLFQVGTRFAGRTR